MRSRASALATAGLTIVVLCVAGCSGAPKFKPNVIGVGDLPFQQLRPEGDPDAAALPKLDDLRGAGAEGGRSSTAARAEYRVGTADIVVVQVWGRPDLGSQVAIGQDGDLRGSTVREDGMIFLPFVGDVTVAGMTDEEIRRDVQEGYSKIIESPQVEVTVDTCRSQSVYLGGDVSRAGVHFLCADVQTVGEVLTRAGGLVATSDPERASLTRDGVRYRLDLLAAERGQTRATDVILRDGDMIHVPSIHERVVHIYGAVRRQGAFPIPSTGMTLLEALSNARGLDVADSSSRKIILVRHDETAVMTYKLTLSELMQAPDIEARDGDSMYVHTNALEKWDRWWRRALPFTTVRTDIQFGGE